MQKTNVMLQAFIGINESCEVQVRYAVASVCHTLLAKTGKPPPSIFCQKMKEFISCTDCVSLIKEVQYHQDMHGRGLFSFA